MKQEIIVLNEVIETQKRSVTFLTYMDASFEISDRSV